MEQESTQQGLIFWLQWPLATAVGVGVGWEVASLVYPVSQGIFYLSIVGVYIGFTQWFVLRNRVIQSDWWILVTLAGWALFDILSWITSPLMLVPLFIALGGLVIGIPQWVLLRRHYSTASSFVLASTFGWILGMIVAFYFAIGGVALGSSAGAYGLSSLAAATFFSIPFGAATAYGLARVLAHPMPDVK